MRVLAMTEPPAATRGYAWYVVGLVCALYVLSYLDRLILGLLVQPIQAEISVSDTQMSLLFGMAFRFWAYRRWVFPADEPAPELVSVR